MKAADVRSPEQSTTEEVTPDISAARAALTRLEHFQTLYPQFSPLVKPAVVALKRETRRTPNRDRAAVLRSVTRGYASFDDILDDTNLNRLELQKLLHAMTQESVISLRRYYAKTNTSNTGRGAPRLIYVLSTTPAGDIYESPAGFHSQTAAMCDSLSRAS